MKRILFVAVAIITLSSCVSTGKYNSMRAEAMRFESELDYANRRIDDMNAANDRLSKEKMLLINDTVRLHNDYNYSQEQLRALNERYAQLVEDGSAEAARMLRELESNQLALQERSRRVAELETMLRQREEAIQSIRSKVANALTGFDGKGLSISVKNGNVYVSMEDKLLFRSGSFDIDPTGAQAVRDLASVLAQNPDINVMVEGHTDNVPYRPNGNLRDNLDLSAKRATTVTRLLLENKNIEPSRIIAAGRGESLPVASGKSAEARARNRRTEIILTPKLDELLSIMENQ